METLPGRGAATGNSHRNCRPTALRGKAPTIFGTSKRALRLSWLAILLLSAALAAAENALVGRWELVDASFPVPEACRGFAFEFTASGLLTGSDGGLEETKTYKAKSYESGYLVETAYVSSNGKNNCQGLPARYVKANTIERIYIELLGDDGMRVYFSDRKAKSFMNFKKAGSSK